MSIKPTRDVQQASLNHTLAGMSTLTDPSPPTDDTDRAQALLQLAISLIDSALDLLGNPIQEDEQLQHESVLMPGGTIGKHLRHVSQTC